MGLLWAQGIKKACLVDTWLLPVPIRGNGTEVCLNNANVQNITEVYTLKEFTLNAMSFGLINKRDQNGRKQRVQWKEFCSRVSAFY